MKEKYSKVLSNPNQDIIIRLRFFIQLFLSLKTDPLTITNRATSSSHTEMDNQNHVTLSDLL